MRRASRTKGPVGGKRRLGALTLSASLLLLTAVGCQGSIGGGVPDGAAGGKSAGGAAAAAGFGGSPLGGNGGDAASAGSGGSSSSSGSGTGGSGGNGAGGQPLCLGPEPGPYCGDDAMQDADPDTLYECPGPNQPPSSATPCPNDCVVEAQGYADHCQGSVSPDGYRLPWEPGVTMTLTQDCFDSCCNDHVGDDGYAWDFANGTHFTVLAARGGTITHLKINSTNGCAASSCVDDANLIVIDHGDNTQSTYLHLQGFTLQPGVSCGATVSRGQPLAHAGTTGWSTGVHLHFQVSQVHTGAPTCECGSSGTGCSASTVPWANFWSTPADPTLAISFDEWSDASSCADRAYMTMPTSQNQ